MNFATQGLKLHFPVLAYNIYKALVLIPTLQHKKRLNKTLWLVGLAQVRSGLQCEQISPPLGNALAHNSHMSNACGHVCAVFFVCLF